MIIEQVKHFDFLILSVLTHLVPVLLSYKDQSIDLHSKSIDWFLYDGNSGTEWINKD